MRAQVGDGLVDFLLGRCGVAVPPVALADAESAVARAERGDDEQDAIGVTVREAGCDLVLFFGKGIDQASGVQLIGTGDDHPPDRIGGIITIDQGKVVGGDREAKFALEIGDCDGFVLRQV